MIKCNPNFEYRIPKISNEEYNICKSLSKAVSNAIARVYPCSFSYKLIYKSKFDAPIRGHHFCKEILIPQKNDILYRKKDYRSKALDLDENVVGMYKEDRLVGHAPIEPSRII